MSLELVRPEVCGFVEPELLDLLKGLPAVENDASEVGVYSTEFRPVFEALALAADVELNQQHKRIGRSSSIYPQGRQIPLSWHQDRPLDYLVTNALPTEFLVGDNYSVGKLMEEQFKTMAKWEKDDRYYLAFNIGRVASNLLDKDLIELGFDIWRPEPFQVIEDNGLQIHRSPQNTTDEIIERQFALLSLGD